MRNWINALITLIKNDCLGYVSPSRAKLIRQIAILNVIYKTIQTGKEVYMCNALKWSRYGELQSPTEMEQMELVKELWNDKILEALRITHKEYIDSETPYSGPWYPITNKAVRMLNIIYTRNRLETQLKRTK